MVADVSVRSKPIARVGNMPRILELAQGHVLPLWSLLVFCLVLLTTLVYQQLVAPLRLSLLLLATAPPLLTAGLLQQLVLEAGPFIFATAREVGAIEARTTHLFVEGRLSSSVELLPLVLVHPLQLSVHPYAGCVALVRHQSRVVFLPTGVALLWIVLDGDGSEILQEIFDGFSDFIVRPDVTFFKQRLTSSLAHLGGALLEWYLGDATFTAKL